MQCGLTVFFSNNQLWAITGNGLYGPEVFACDMRMARYMGLGRWILRSKETLSSGSERLLDLEWKQDFTAE